MKCTWLDCEREASVPQLSNNNSIWANLCTEHDALMEQAIVNGDVKLMLASWVKANGGAKELARKM
jgi:hypothetical protein